MIDFGEETYSLSEFQHNAAEHIRRLKESGLPAVLTVNGEAEVVVQSADAYRKLFDVLDSLETMAGIRRGLETMEEGEGRPAQEVFDRLEKKYAFLQGE